VCPRLLRAGMARMDPVTEAELADARAKARAGKRLGE
jgi:hypothetical protein